MPSNAEMATTGKFVKKMRASTQIPIEHKISNTAKKNNATAPVRVVALDTHCQTCSSSNHNELVMKAFKMACLQYNPGAVHFENHTYSR